MKKRLFSIFLSVFLTMLAGISMSQTYHVLSGGAFSQNWTNTGLITTSNVWSGVPSIIGYRGDDLTITTGTDPQTIVAPGLTTPLNVSVNQTNPNTNTSGGLAEFEITNPTVAFQGSGTADAPFLVIFLDATGVSNIHIDYNLRDVDGSADNAIQAVALQYRVGTTGDFINIPAGFIADASTGPSLATLVTPVAVTLPSDCNNQAQVQIRIMTTNAGGSDEWIGIDDIVVTPNYSGVDAIPPQVASVSVPTSTTVNVVFNEAVNPLTAQDVNNYTGLGTISSAVLDGAGTTVTLTLATALTLGANNTLTVSNVTDLGNNPLAAPYIYNFYFNNTVGQLVISEIYYNDPNTVNTEDMLEFIELYNAGATAIELGGYTFSAGVVYTFPQGTLGAGQYLVLAKYPADILSFFGVTSTAWTSGSLDNAGETLQIVNSVGTVIDVVVYDDVAPWPSTPDGAGPSLVICDPLADNSLAANWTAAAITNYGPYDVANVYATPGASNCAPVLNPVLSFDPTSLQVNETNNTVTFTVTITNQNSNPTSVNVSLGVGTATEISDFTFTPITLTFPASSSDPLTVTVNIVNDTEFEGNETVVLLLSNATNNATISNSTATLTIVSDDIAPVTDDLFFSEYIEGAGGNNKAIEIFNPTSSTIDLTQYQVKLGANGGVWNPTALNMPGTLAPGAVYVIANSGSVASILAVADTTHSVTFFNGDDAVGLFKNGVLIDAIGVQGIDPGTGWNVAGVTTGTLDHTLVRKLTVTHGNADWTSSAGTSTENSEWIVYEANNFTFIGWHGNQNTPPSISAITMNPIMAIPSTPVNISATISDDGTVASATMNWGLATGSLTNSISMTLVSGNIWAASSAIPAQLAGTTVYYKITATDDDATSSSSAELSYVVAPEPAVVTIQQIQTPTDFVTNDSPYNNLTVITTGVVTGRNATGYFIQNGTGTYSGVYVYDPTNVVAQGDNVTITGLVFEYFNMTEIKNLISTVIISSANTLPNPAVLTLADMIEPYEGVLVRFNNATCSNVALGSGEWQLTDASGTGVVDDLHFAFTPTLSQAYQVTGPVYYSFLFFKVEPRDANDIIPAVSQSVNLNSGWNLISTYIIPFNTSIVNVFSGVVSNIRIVKNGSGQIYWPAVSVNTIGNMVLGQGYQVNSLAACTLVVTGVQAVPETTPLNYLNGWNMIGYLRTSSAPIVSMLSPIVSSIVIVKNGAGQVYWPIFSINSIVNMNPGLGYQMKVNGAQTLTYPANTSSTAKSVWLNAPSHFNMVEASDNNMVAGFPSEVISGIANPGDEIAAFDSNGKLSGSAVYTGEALALTIWGDDEMSNAKDGLNVGETFRLVIWNQKTNNEATIKVKWMNGSSSYSANDIKVATVAEALTLIPASVFPNPTDSECAVRFSTEETGMVEFSLFDMSGKKLESPANRIFEAGNHEISLDVSELVSGKYLLIISGTAKTEQLTIQVVK